MAHVITCPALAEDRYFFNENAGRWLRLRATTTVERRAAWPCIDEAGAGYVSATLVALTRTGELLPIGFECETGMLQLADDEHHCEEVLGYLLSRIDPREAARIARKLNGGCVGGVQ